MKTQSLTGLFGLILGLTLTAAPFGCSSEKGGGDGDGAEGGTAGGDEGSAGKGQGGGSAAGGTGGGGGQPAPGGGGGEGDGTGGASAGSGGSNTGGTMTGGTGGTMTGGTAGGMAGSGGSAGTGGTPAAKTVTATIAAIEGGTITGTVTFTQEANGVKVVYMIENCPTGKHQTHIHAGTGCMSRDQQGMHWDGARGEGIPDLMCDADKKATLTYTRMSNNASQAWTIGDGKASDIVGHPVVVHGLNNSDRHGCGVIKTP